MSQPRFSPGAAVLWGTLPDDVKKRILKNVFCVKCCQAVEITNFTVTNKDGGLILKGQCAKCGHEVIRVVEGSGTNWEKN